MSKTFNTANYFDLIDFVRNITDIELAAQGMQALAFRVDLLIQSNARAIFRTLRDEEFNKLVTEQQTADARAELENLFRSVDFAEKTFSEYTDRISGNVSTLKSLSMMRDGINELACELTAMTTDWRGDPRTYTAASLDQLFLARPDLRITASEQLRSRQTIEMMKERGILPTNMDTEAMMKLEQERRHDELSRMATTMHSQGPITLMFYEMALQADGEVVQNFYDLGTDVQLVCISAVSDALQRSIDRAKSDRRLSQIEFMARLGCGMTAMKELQDVLRSPRLAKAMAEAA